MAKYVDIIAKSIGILNRIQYLLPKFILLNLYYSLIYPYLSYCNLIWASNYPSRLKVLMMLQRRAVRIVAKQYYEDDTDHLFSRLRILKIESVNKFLIAEFMYKYERKLLPQVFDGYVLHSYQIHSYNTRSQDNFRSTYARTNTRFFNIKCNGPLVWNTLPVHIRCLPTLQLFKQQLRSFLNDTRL